jgi:hypothetical protein
MRWQKTKLARPPTLNGIGMVYASIGQPEQALEYFNQALQQTVEELKRLLEPTELC